MSLSLAWMTIFITIEVWCSIFSKIGHTSINNHRAAMLSLSTGAIRDL